MLGGYQILDLRGIDLTISESASDITNANVLNQLLKLRDYIDKAYNFSKPLENQLKPVLIRFRDKKANEKIEGAAFGELSLVNNYYSFKITARLSGVLVLTINVTFEEVDNGYGNYEWVIDDATIQLADETQTISGDLEVTGDLSVGVDVTITDDLSVGGDVEVNGDLEADKISGNEIIENMSGYIFYPVANDTVWEREYIYAGVCKNGNKLTFVICVNLTCLDKTGVGEIALGSFEIPASILAKLYPTIIGGASMLDERKIAVVDSTNYTLVSDAKTYTQKIATGITMAIIMPSDREDNQKYFVRQEVTFLLSDNLIPQE